MKRFFGIISVLALVGLTLTSCTSVHYEEMQSGDAIQLSHLPVKDYDIIAPIKITTKVTESESIFKVDKSKYGSEIVYQLLLEESYKLGGNEVVNVRVARSQDVKIEYNHLLYDKNAYYLKKKEPFVAPL